MNNNSESPNTIPATLPTLGVGVPITQLVREVYATAPPAVRAGLLSQLVAKVYESAAPNDRSRLLGQLLRPLGVLSVVAVANGVFASIRFRSGWPDLQVRVEDARNVRASDIVALVNHVQQVSVQAVDGLAQLLLGSPALASSAAAALLINILLQRARTRRATDAQTDG